MKRNSTNCESLKGRQAKKTNSYGPSKIPQYFPGEKKRTKAVPDFGKLHEKWQKQLEVGKICNKKPQTVPTEFKLSKSNKADQSNFAKKQLFSDEEFEADHKSLEAILHGLPGRGIASRRATTATGKDVKRSQSCTSFGSRRVLGELPLDPDQTSKANRRRSRSARAEVPLKVLKESAEVKFEPDPQALRSIISSEGMTPSRVAAPKRQTTTGGVIRQERPSIYDAMTSSRHLNSKFATVQMANKVSKFTHHMNWPQGSPVQRVTQPCRDPPQDKPRKPVEQQPQSLAEEFEVDPQSMRSIINSDGMTPVRVTAPVRKTLGGPVIRQERPSIYDAMTSSRNNTVFGNVRLSEYRAGPRTGKLLKGAVSSPAPTVFPLGRTPAKGPVPDLIKSATKSEARRVLRNECGILTEGPSKKGGEQKHVKWADVFEESTSEEKDNVQRTLFSTVEDSEEEDECKENICPVTKQLTPAKTGQQGLTTVKSTPQSSGIGQSQMVTNNGQKVPEANEVQALPSNLNNNKSNSVTQASYDPKTEDSSEIYGLVSHLSNDLEVGGESRGFASSTDGTVYKRGLLPSTADKANCHDDSPHVSEDVLPISGDGSCIIERVTHSCVVPPQAYSRQYAGDTQCFSNLRNATCSEQHGLRAANLEFSKNLGNRSLQGLQNSKESHCVQGLQNVPGKLAEISNLRLQNPKGKVAYLQSRSAQAASSGCLEGESEHKQDNAVYKDWTQTQRSLETLDHTASSNDFNVQIIKESLPTSSRSYHPIKNCREQGKKYASVEKQAQCDQKNLNSEEIRHFPNYIVRKHSFQEHGSDDKQEAVVRPYSTGLGDQHLEGQCNVRKPAITKEILVENKTEQTIMAMFTETEQDENSQASTTSAREQASSGERTRDSVGNFVGRVQKNKKRQSIAELNESISESNVHMQSLCHQAQSLRNQSKTRKNTNIMYQLELIRKQQEELVKLQRELQQQLQMEAEYQEVEGHTDNQWDESGSCALDAKVSDLISSSEEMLTLQSDEQTQNLESIQEEESNNNYDSPFVVKSPLIPYSRQESFSVSEPSNVLLASNKLLSTPKAPHISQNVQGSLLTPRLSNLICDSQNNFAFIQSPKPLKPAPSAKREGAKSPSPPPIWTAMALKSEAERHKMSDPPTTLSAKRRLDQEPDYAKTAEEPMDLSLKPLTETSFNSSAENKRSMISESTLCASSPKLFHSEDIGSLSLRANTMKPQNISHDATSSHPSSRHFQPTQEIPLYKEVLSIANEQKYREALLDDECARYCCRIQAAQSLVFWSERCINPVSIILSQGDEMHFVPIHEEMTLPVTVGGDSAFYSYSP